MTLDQAIQFVKNRLSVIRMDVITPDTIKRVEKIISAVSTQKIAEFEIIAEGEVFKLIDNRSTNVFNRIQKPFLVKIKKDFSIINISEIVELSEPDFDLSTEIRYLKYGETFYFPFKGSDEIFTVCDIQSGPGASIFIIRDQAGVESLLRGISLRETVIRVPGKIEASYPAKPLIFESDPPEKIDGGCNTFKISPADSDGNFKFQIEYDGVDDASRKITPHQAKQLIAFLQAQIK